jgi:prepilin-type processing-associated H-X9-DG protein
MTDNESTIESAGVPPMPVKEVSLGQRILQASVVVAIIAVLVALLLPAQRGRNGAQRSVCKNNLKLIGLALHIYHDDFGNFPSAYIPDIYGNPMHSWRVFLLPHLDQAPLYNQYRFDEPWDSAHNRQLGEAGLPVFTCPTDADGDRMKRRRFDTSYVAVIGDRTAWQGARPTALRDFKDGTSNTLLVVEVANSGIHWMEPRDLHVSQMASKINAKSGQGVSSRHQGVAYALMADGSVRSLSDTMSENVLQSLLTINGGEEIPEF